MFVLLHLTNMRKDMNKVLVERSRIKGRDSKGRTANKSMEDLPKKESMKKPHRDRKTLNENLNPLKRFLQSKVGQHWDKVYSEISENLKNTNAVQQHVRDHIWDFVNKNVTVDEGVVKTMRSYGGKFRELRNNDLYICPTSGLLKKYSAVKIKKDKNSVAALFSHRLNSLSGHKSKLFINDQGEVYKRFENKDTNRWDIVVKANATHALHDYKEKWAGSSSAILEFFKSYWKNLDDKNPYFQKYLELIQSSEKVAKKEDAAKPKFKVGDEVSFSHDSGKTYTVGIVNRVENLSTWVSVGTNNFMVSHFIPRHKIHLNLKSR